MNSKCPGGTEYDKICSFLYVPVKEKTNAEIIKELEDQLRIKQLKEALGDVTVNNGQAIDCDGCSVERPYLIMLLWEFNKFIFRFKDETSEKIIL